MTILTVEINIFDAGSQAAARVKMPSDQPPGDSYQYVILKKGIAPLAIDFT